MYRDLSIFSKRTRVFWKVLSLVLPGPQVTYPFMDLYQEVIIESPKAGSFYRVQVENFTDWVLSSFLLV